MPQWYHVIPVIDWEAGEGSRKVLTGWAIKGEDNERVSRKYDTRHMSKKQVVAKARDMTHSHHPGVIIHNNNGRVVDVWVNSEYMTNVENDYSTPKPQFHPKQHEEF